MMPLTLALLLAVAAPILPKPPVTPPSGDYSFASGSGICLRARRDAPVFQKPYIQTIRCGANPTMHLTNIGGDWYHVLNTAGNRCATVARGVLAGAPRIDSLPCEANAEDQKFQLVPVAGSGNFMIRTKAGQCWNVRPVRNAMNSFMNDGDVVVGGCEGAPAQVIAITKLSTPPTDGPG